MTIYQLLNEKNNLTTIVKLIRNRIILDSTVLQHISIYDSFYKMEGKKKIRYESLAKEYNLSARTIQRIILKLNKNAK